VAKAITLEMLKQMFARMRKEAPFDPADELLWGYFFTNAKKKALRPVAEELVALGYREVALYLTDDESTYFLHMERVEKHTPETLHARNLELYALAERHGIDSYDGMDVGPVDDDDDED
jgi:Regulator of ribonuclease activity B